MLSILGNRFWVFKDTMLQPSYPQDISLFGSGMPTQCIETAVWWEDVAKTYFFKGDRSVQKEASTIVSKCTVTAIERQNVKEKQKAKLLFISNKQMLCY